MSNREFKIKVDACTASQYIERNNESEDTFEKEMGFSVGLV